MSEFVDLYDRNRNFLNRVVDRNTYLFQPGEFMMYVLAILENEEGKFLVTQRALDKKWAAGGWEMPGGGAKSKESSLDAIKREVKEETGLTLTSYKFRGLVTFINSECESELMCVFTADGYTGELIECNEGELCWVDKKIVPELPTWEGDKVFLNLLLSEEKRFFSVKLQYEGELLANTEIRLY